MGFPREKVPPPWFEQYFNIKGGGGEGIENIIFLNVYQAGNVPSIYQRGTSPTSPLPMTPVHCSINIKITFFRLVLFNIQSILNISSHVYPSMAAASIVRACVASTLVLVVETIS